MTRYMRWIAILAAVIFAGCAGVQDKSVGEFTAAKGVTLYGGYNLGSLLNHPVTVRTVADIRKIMGAAWNLPVEVTVSGDRANAISIPNCNEYLDHMKRGLRVVREEDVAMFNELAMMCRASAEILEAKPARVSYVDALVLDDKAPNILPIELGLFFTDDDQKRAMTESPNGRWSDASHIKRVERIGKHVSIYYSDIGAQEVEWVAKGDFNGDGTEELMLSSRDSYEGYGLRDGRVRLYLLTRDTPDGEYKLVEEFKY